MIYSRHSSCTTEDTLFDSALLVSLRQLSCILRWQPLSHSSFLSITAAAPESRTSGDSFLTGPLFSPSSGTQHIGLLQAQLCSLPFPGSKTSDKVISQPGIQVPFPICTQVTFLPLYFPLYPPTTPSFRLLETRNHFYSKTSDLVHLPNSALRNDFPNFSHRVLILFTFQF